MLDRITGLTVFFHSSRFYPVILSKNGIPAFAGMTKKTEKRKKTGFPLSRE